VSQTHKQQMAVMFLGLFVAFGLLVSYIPLDFMTSMKVAGELGKMEIINLEFDPTDRYNIWSGILGGLFLQLSYFGTDQSQVQRYLTGKSMRDSRLGLMFNGLVKIPMQFFILLIGVLIFLFYLFVMPPLHFNTAAVEKVKVSEEHKAELQQAEAMHKVLFNEKKKNVEAMAAAIENGDDPKVSHYRDEIKEIEGRQKVLKESTTSLIHSVDPKAATLEEADFVFLDFIIHYMPVGVIGLLFAMIFSGAMSSTSAELNALASTTTVDMYKRNFHPDGTEKHFLFASKGFTFLWGIFALGFAILASKLGNLIEAVNVLGSIFYPVILGIFLVAFFIKFVKANAVFLAALVTQGVVIVMYFYTDIAFLWYNLIGVGLVIVLAMVLQFIIPDESNG
jgi:Na+/proline symporter